MMTLAEAIEWVDANIDVKKSAGSYWELDNTLTDDDVLQTMYAALVELYRKCSIQQNGDQLFKKRASDLLAEKRRAFRTREVGFNSAKNESYSPSIFWGSDVVYEPVGASSSWLDDCAQQASMQKSICAEYRTTLDAAQQWLLAPANSAFLKDKEKHLVYLVFDLDPTHPGRHSVAEAAEIAGVAEDTANKRMQGLYKRLAEVFGGQYCCGRPEKKVPIVRPSKKEIGEQMIQDGKHGNVIQFRRGDQGFDDLAAQYECRVAAGRG